MVQSRFAPSCIFSAIVVKIIKLILKFATFSKKIYIACSVSKKQKLHHILADLLHVVNMKRNLQGKLVVAITQLSVC